MNFSELNIEMVFALMSGKLSAAINRKLYRSFRKLSIDITPEQWTVLYYLWSREWLDRQIKRYAEDKVGLWGAVLKENGELIGQCGITMQPYREQTVPEIGYLIRKNFWHKGYATEAARSCADYASHILGIKRIYSIIRDNNLPSQGVAKRIGMTPGDTIVKHYRGIDMPHIVFSMTLGE